MKLIFVLLFAFTSATDNFDDLLQNRTLIYHHGEDVTTFIFIANWTCTIRDNWYVKVFYYEHDNIEHDYISEVDMNVEGKSWDITVTTGWQNTDRPNKEYYLASTVFHNCEKNGRELQYNYENFEKVEVAGEKNYTLFYNQTLDGQGRQLIADNWRNTIMDGAPDYFSQDYFETKDKLFFNK